MLVENNSNPWYYKILYFFIANQVVFKRLFVVLLILLNIFVWWSAGVKLVNYWSGSFEYNKILNELTQQNIDWQNYHLKNSPENLQTIAVNKIKNKNNYDLIAEVFNPNSNWLVSEIEYAFDVDGYVTDWRTDFVLPNRKKFLITFSYESQNVKDVDLKIKNIKWQKIKDQDKINILNNISVQDKKYSEQTNISQINFKISNNSSFNFWQTGWQVVLYQKQKPIAAHYATKNKFLSGEQVDMSVVWSQKIGFPTNIEILPDINIFDETNFITQTETPPVNLIKGVKDKK